ncbi:MAG TPA: DUF418 domain-containing protein [Thermoanaerobaculia bacterium]|nr:DUF418 domain-containing protein [Thermoanaerobaculia bacterium]
MSETPLRPVSSSERIELLDILRGLALFGILAANMRGFAGPAAAYFNPASYWPAFADRLAQAFIDTFVQGKFITIFAFLFGLGFAVQLERSQARAGRFGWTYARRLAILLVIGFLHGLLIWWGDILLAYSVIGFVLLFFRKRADKTVAVWAAICLSFPILLMTGAFAAGAHEGLPAPTAAEIARITDVMANGSWTQVQAQRLADVKTYNWSFVFIFAPNLLGLFLAGAYAWRKRLLLPSPELLPRYRRAMIFGLSFGIAWNVILSLVRWFSQLPLMPATPTQLVLSGVGVFSTLALSMGYICAVILLAHDTAWHARLRVFAPLGRTALTNYLLQSVIGNLLFYGYGLGLFGRVGPALLLAMTFAIYAAQVAASIWWLARYRFGPMEWVWRRLTYPGPLPMRREERAAGTALAA